MHRKEERYNSDKEQETSMTVNEFEKKLTEQREEHILKWRELKENKVYTITDFYEIDAFYGKTYVIVLKNGQRVFTPSALSNLLKKKDNIATPFYIRPTGLKASRKNENYEFHSFDVVFKY